MQATDNVQHHTVVLSLRDYFAITTEIGVTSLLTSKVNVEPIRYTLKDSTTGTINHIFVYEHVHGIALLYTRWLTRLLYQSFDGGSGSMTFIERLEAPKADRP